ncbi:MAG: PAS domain S-box protein, partial [Methanomicrobiales archaeon]
MPDQLRILYVDDELSLLDLGKLFLEESGRFSVEIISSAPAALTLLNATKFDAIISDYQMPGMDGIQFLKSVRASGNAIPFILFTGRGREEIVIQALNEGASFYLQKGGEPEAQFAELAHKIHISVEHHRAAEKIQALNRLYSVLSLTNKAIFRIQTKREFFSEICRILVETGGFRMAWVGLADPEQKIIRPAASAGHVDGYLDSINISTEDVPEGRGPTGTAYREGKYYWSNDITQDPRMEPWRESALKRGYLANAAFSFALGTKNAGILSVYAPVTGFFNGPIIELLEELAVDISFYLRTIDDQNDRKRSDEELLRKSEELWASYEKLNATNEELRHTMDELAGSEKLFRTLFQEMLNGFAVHEIICDENGKPQDYRFIDVNPAFERMTDLHREDLIGKTVREVLPGIESLWIERYGRVALTGSTDHFENYSGDLGRSFEVTVYQNAPYQFTTVISDITERKRAEADLRVSEEALSAMLNGITESAFLMTPEGIVIAANETIARRLGLKQADDLVGQNVLRLLPEDVQMSREIKIREVIQSGLPVHFEDVRLGRVISQTIYPVKDPDGIVRRLTIFGVDVTDRKLTEETLHETEARLRLALRSAKSGTWDW